MSMYDLTIDEEWYMLNPQKAVFRKEQPFKAETKCAPASFFCSTAACPKCIFTYKNWILQRNTVYLL